MTTMVNTIILVSAILLQLSEVDSESIVSKDTVVKRSDDCIKEDGFDRLWSDINDGVQNIKNSPDECCEDCEGNSRCLSWSFGKDTGHCWLKNTVPDKIPNAGTVTGVVEKQDCNKEVGFDRLWSDINNGVDNVKKSADECCVDCRGNSRCLSWSFNNVTGDCWLKNTVPDKSPNAYTVTGVVEKQDCNKEDGYDRLWSDINNGVENVKKSADECCVDCRGNWQCVSWSFNKTTGACWLKYTVPDKITNAGTVTGVVDKQDCNKEDGFDRLWNDINNGEENSKNNADECCVDCRRNSQCRAWAFNKVTGACWLKNTVTGTVPNSDTVTGVV